MGESWGTREDGLKRVEDGKRVEDWKCSGQSALNW